LRHVYKISKKEAEQQQQNVHSVLLGTNVMDSQFGLGGELPFYKGFVPMGLFYIKMARIVGFPTCIQKRIK